MRLRFVVARLGERASRDRLNRGRIVLLCAALLAAGVAFGLWRTPPSNPVIAPQASQAPQTSQLSSPAESAGTGNLKTAGGGASGGSGNSSPKIELVTYTVQPGDTLTSIASKFNTSVDSIASINGLPSPDRINPGDHLSVMTNSSGSVVRVASGDTLWDISARYGIDVEDIVRANNLTDPTSLQVGQLLLLPGVAVRSALTASRSMAFIWPADGYVSSGFGWRIHPVTGEELFHEGIDIAADEGSRVYAAGAGTVTFRGWDGGYGRLIVVEHAGGLETRYGHLSGYEVVQGQYVSAGQVIGYVGQSGTTTGPNLHFEVRKNGKALNPANYLP